MDVNSNNLVGSIEAVPKDKKLIIFDLDGTLAGSKSDIDEEMAILFGKLLGLKQVAVIGGGKYETFQKQLLGHLSVPEELSQNLFLFPVTATAFYKYNGGNWQKVYSQELSVEEKEKILSALEKTFAELNYKHPEKIYGEFIEDRGGEMVFSALGQDAPAELKQKWKEENPNIRLKMEETLQNLLPDMEVKVTGLTSIDITPRGIDKGYGIRQIEKLLKIQKEDILFVGDAFFREGNDEPVLTTGVLCFEVSGPEDTKRIIRHLIK